MSELISLVDAAKGPKFALSKEGKPLKTMTNCLMALKGLGLVINYDQFNHRVMLSGNKWWDERQGNIYNDSLCMLIKLRITTEYGIEFALNMLHEAIMTAAHAHLVHPVQEYLSGLEWDKISRIDTWLTEFLGVDDTPYSRAVGRKWLVAAVTRIMSPGAKFDNALVLEGKQGVGKSSALRALAGKAWFSDSLPGDLHKADAVQALQGAWIMEMGEMDTLNRSQTATIKAFLSREVDKARFAYAKTADTYPRQCVFAGTTNESAYLKDATGGRRFWPVKAKMIDLVGLEADRDQLWAEAKAAYESGESLLLDVDLWDAANKEQEERQADDPWADKLLQFVNGVSLGGVVTSPRDKVFTRDLLDHAINIPVDRQTQAHYSRIKNLMISVLGWEYKKSVKIKVGDKSVVAPGYVRPLRESHSNDS